MPFARLPSIIVADHVPAAGLQSWERQIELLRSVPDAEKTLRLLLEPLPTWATLTVDSNDNFGLFLGALCASRRLTAFVQGGHRAFFYAIKPCAWEEREDSVIFPRIIASTGKFLPIAGIYPVGSLENALVGHYLFVRHNELRKILHRPLSNRPGARALAEKIIKEHLESSPTIRMKKADFIATIRSDYPLSDREISGIWGELSPESWRTAGRK